MGEITVDTTFKKYGLNNVQILFTDCVSNRGNAESSFLITKFLKHCNFMAMFARDLIKISG